MQLSTKQKTILVGVVIAILVISLTAIVIAATVWSGTRTYTKPEQAFTVDKPTSLDYGVGNSFTEVFTITNTGNTAITITASATGTGASFGWDKTSATIQSAATVTFTLTTTVTVSGTSTVLFTPS